MDAALTLNNLDQFISNGNIWISIAVAGLVALLLFSKANRLISRLMQTAMTNERLFLMGLTSLALSLASGWTTYQGMNNFTHLPVLNFLITFGVQGIMLVSAWMIGEAFTTKNKNNEGLTSVLGPFASFKLWLNGFIFLFSMMISVFFSFDSLFSAIFSANERQRAGEIRSLNQISGVMTDIRERIDRRQIEAQDLLFQSAAWAQYQQQLNKLSRIARSTPELVEERLLGKMQTSQQEIAKYQDQLASYEGEKARLSTLKAQLIETLGPLKQSRGKIANEVIAVQSQIANKKTAIESKRIEAQSEARGIGDTGRVGEGPRYRELSEQLTRLEAERDVLSGQLERLQIQLSGLDQKIAANLQSQAKLNGEMAKIEGQAQIAKQFIASQKERQRRDGARDLSAFTSINALEREVETFRQSANKPNYTNLKKSCITLHTALLEIEALRSQLNNISCEAGTQTNALAARIFDFQEGRTSLAAACGGQQMGAQKTIDQQIALGQKCLSLSRLPKQDADEFRTILRRVDLNRDDKAHNFVVTLNALEDGNWLAFLALALALAIDGLVFISGLIGAKTAAYDLAGSPAEIVRYGLGATAEIYGSEPEDILTRKIFLKYVSRMNDEHKPVIDLAKVSAEDVHYINKVLSIAGSAAKQVNAQTERFQNRRYNPLMPSAIFAIEESFYQNLVRQVYLWDEFYRPRKLRTEAALRKTRTQIDPGKNKTAVNTEPPFGQLAKGAVTRKGTDSPFIPSGPERESGSVPAIAQTLPTEKALAPKKPTSKQIMKQVLVAPGKVIQWPKGFSRDKGKKRVETKPPKTGTDDPSENA